MYLACRHIKPGGEQCKSPALKGHAFCYYHARQHSTTKLGVTDDIAFPIPEDSRAIQESLGTIFQAILNSRIDSKKAAQLLWGLQIASNNLPRKPQPDPKSVASVTRNRDGAELAPVFKVCDPWIDCERCADAKTCDRYFDFDELVGNKKTVDPPKDKPCIDEHGVIFDEEEYRRQYLRDPHAHDDDDDNDDEEDGKSLFESLRFYKRLNHTLGLPERPKRSR